MARISVFSPQVRLAPSNFDLTKSLFAPTKICSYVMFSNYLGSKLLTGTKQALLARFLKFQIQSAIDRSTDFP